MKKYKKSILSIAVFLGTIGGFTSCDMDVAPTEKVSSVTFWKSANEASLFLNAIYSSGVPGMGVYLDTYTEDVFCQYEWESRGASYMQNSSTSDIMAEYYGNKGGGDYDFTCISRCNELLTNIDQCQMDATLKERMKAEARFFRAIEYLTMTVALGDAPIFEEVLDPNQKEFERNPASEVRAFVMKELEEVAGILPVSYSGGTYNEKARVTRYAAWAFLSRAALLFEDYTTAERAAREVMAGPFSLFKITSLTPAQEAEAKEIDLYVDYAANGIDRDKFIKGIFSYEELWQAEYAGVTNPEYVLTREYADNVKGQEDGSRFTNLRTNQMGGWASITPTQQLVNAYWTVKGEDPTVSTPADRTKAYEKILADLAASGLTHGAFSAAKVADGSIASYDFIKEYRNRDARMYASILFPFKGWFQTEKGTNFYFQTFLPGAKNESLTGYGFRKITAQEESSSGEGNSAADFPSYRFAETLLTFAEAHTRNTGYDAEVVSALNQIRDRVGMPAVPASFPSKDAAIDFILKEKRIELAGEGNRSRDVVRLDESYWRNAWNNVELFDLYGNSYIKLQWDSRMRLRPMRADALMRNKLLEQNPGY